MRSSTVRLLALLAALAAGTAHAERPADRLVASRPGPLYGTPDGGEGELLAFDGRLAPALASLAAGERLAVDAWPVAPGVSRTMILTRTEVYAPDARIVAIGKDGEVAVPRSTWAFFQGRDAAGSARVAIALDPATGALRGLSSSERGLHELLPPDTWTGGRHRLAASETRDADGSPRTWKCSEEDLPLAPSGPPASGAGAREALAVRTPLAAFTKYAVVAIDTDNEFMSLKFSDNTTNATNYIANLFNLMNLIYERDVQLHLLQGYTILRLSSTTDPYTVNSGSNASGSELNEFSNYWGSRYGGVKRMLAAMLSGKQPTTNSASGVAWIGGLCSTGFGYSFNKILRNPGDTSSFDVLITAHEMGHNFGSPHTHCYSPPADNCYNAGGGGCYSGPQSCPGVVPYNGYTSNGTLMSYCHLISCAGGATLVFHPRSLGEYMNSNIAAASSCIFNGAVAPTGPTVSGIVPATGPTAGGTTVTINGSGFVSGATVAFVDLTGSVSLTSVTFVNAGQLTAATPGHVAGVMDVVVFNPNNSTGTLPGGYTFGSAGVPPPPPVSAATTFNAITPCRLLDTRNVAGPLGGPSIGAGGLRSFVA
ncbi:MAG: M12 family metallo-peptidase, partial [Acidobacteriota bacterium]|nr:M12 family metallo-peptidase [Acidobacteriota bacterium]